MHYEMDVDAGLEQIAKQRGITVQELIRAVIIPDWMQSHGLLEREV
ncbi:MAG: hypothetical protein QXO67_03095 [Candidatus Bathyarchaeia archaeon]